MASFNRIILAGNMTRDPQLKYLANNTAVCEFGLAVNHKWRDREGNQREEVCFVDLAAFGRAGEIINQYMSKGRPILVEGRLKYDTWTGQDGAKRSKHSVVVENFTFLGGARDGGGGAGGDSAGAPAQRGGGYERGPAPGGGGYEREPAPGGGGYEREPAAGAGGYQRSGQSAGGYSSGAAPAMTDAPPPDFEAPPQTTQDDIPF